MHTVHQIKTIGTDQVITGEAVALDIAPASPYLRVLASLFDFTVICTVAASAWSLLLYYLLEQSEAWQSVGVILTLVCFFLLYPILIETVTKGQSLGKILVGIKIVRDDGGPVQFRHVFVRQMTVIAEIWFTAGVAAFVTSMVSKRGKRLGDFLAGTYAVRLPAHNPVPPLIMPPELAQWAGQAQVGAIPPGLQLNARRFLNISRDMTGHFRYRQAAQFANQLLTYVQPAPPSFKDPERIIAAVLVKRRDQEWRQGLKKENQRQDLARQMSTLPFGIAAH